jgi:hypothetical protein
MRCGLMADGGGSVAKQRGLSAAVLIRRDRGATVLTYSSCLNILSYCIIFDWRTSYRATIGPYGEELLECGCISRLPLKCYFI